MTETRQVLILSVLVAAVLVAEVACVRQSVARTPPNAAERRGLALGSDEVPEPLALGILDQALPLRADGSGEPVPTPFAPSFILEVTTAGNVVLPPSGSSASGASGPLMLVVAGKCPPELVPPRCREDFLRLPRGASLVCMRDAALNARVLGEPTGESTKEHGQPDL